MATTYPTTKQTIPNPTSADLLDNADNTLDHDYQHGTANDTIEALQDKVGIDGSAVTTSHDYKLSAVTGSAKALTSGTSTQSVTGLTLVNPVVTLGSDATGDIYYRNAGGVFTRLPIGATDQILAVQSGLPAWVANPSASNASYSAKGVVQLLTDEATSGLTVASGVISVNTGTTANKIVKLDSSARLPAVDGSLLTNLPAVTTFKNGVFSQNANSSTTTTIAHGLGKTPKMFRIHGYGGGTNAGVYTHGSYNGTNNYSIHKWYDTNGGTSGSNSDSTSCVWVSYGSSTGSGQTLYIKGVATWDATNITITWTVGGAGNSSLTVYYEWEAEA